MNDFLRLPEREIKPRKRGLTVLIDNGYPTKYFSDVLECYSEFIDFIKFGWGTAYITKNIREKIAIAKQFDINLFMGGTFFEKAYIQGELTNYLRYLDALGLSTLEISNGTISLPEGKKVKQIHELSSSFCILSEVGYKDEERSKMMHPAQWVSCIKMELEAGAWKVITEARESGTSGVCRSNGELRYGLIEEIKNSGISYDNLIFEAPTKYLQTYFIKHIGYDVNLANISFNEVIALETLRQGLRSDTMLASAEQTQGEVYA